MPTNHIAQAGLFKSLWQNVAPMPLRPYMVPDRVGFTQKHIATTGCFEEGLNYPRLLAIRALRRPPLSQDANAPPPSLEGSGRRLNESIFNMFTFSLEAVRAPSTIALSAASRTNLHLSAHPHTQLILHLTHSCYPIVISADSVVVRALEPGGKREGNRFES